MCPANKKGHRPRWPFLLAIETVRFELLMKVSSTRSESETKVSRSALAGERSERPKGVILTSPAHEKSRPLGAAFYRV